MINELINEIKELQQYKKLYECAIKDKERLAKYVYENERKKYWETKYEDRVKKHQEEHCKDCRYNDDCKVFEEGLDADILKPKENKGWFPSYKVCENFKWN